MTAIWSLLSRLSPSIQRLHQQSKSYAEVQQADLLADWQQVAARRTPKIATVGGYALGGGGCELAMMCDLIYAADTAQ